MERPTPGLSTAAQYWIWHGFRDGPAYRALGRK